MSKYQDIESFVSMCNVMNAPIVNMGKEGDEDYHNRWLMILDHTLLWHGEVNFRQGYFRLLTLIEPTQKIKSELEKYGLKVTEGCLKNAFNRSLECEGDVFPVLLEINEILDKIA